MKFRPDIEGLRALAVVPVVIFHVWPQAVPGGYVGVDIFFVISGYLITTLLLQRLDSHSYSIIDFYGARIRRIFPALFTMLTASSLAALLLLPPAPLKEFARTLVATALFASNIELYRLSDYFAGAAEFKPLLHTWSLAVEEQFYIVFPPLLALLYRYAHRWLLPVFLGLAGASLASSIWLLQKDPAAAFYFAPPRAFELLIGSMLAAHELQHPGPRRWREATAVMGLILIAWAMVGFDSGTPFPGMAALVPAVGAGLLIWSGGGDAAAPTHASTLLRSTPVRWIGLASYSLYLWHWPVMVFTRHLVLGEPGMLARCAAVALSFLLAALSVRFVERPFRHARSGDRRLFAFGFACMFAASSAALITLQRAGFENRFDAQALQLFAAERDSSPRRHDCHGVPERSIPYASRCIFGAAGAPATVAVWGDSHGAELAYALGQVATEAGSAVAQITSSSCPPAPEYAPPRRPLCVAHNDETLREMVADPALREVVMVARYAVYPKADRDALESGLHSAIARLTDAGKQVVLIEPIPDFGYPVPAALGLLQARGAHPAGYVVSLAHYRTDQAPALQMLQHLSEDPQLMRYAPTTTLCKADRCAGWDDGHAMYFDDNHLSVAGAMRLAVDLWPRLHEAVEPDLATGLSVDRPPRPKDTGEAAGHKG